MAAAKKKSTIKPVDPPWTTQPLKPWSRRPQLRCPACGAAFSPPADFCPECRIDLRIGARRKRHLLRRLINKIPPQYRRPVKKGLYLGGLMILAISAYAGFQGYRNRSPAAPTDMPARPPDNFQRLSKEYPVLLRPYVIMFKTRAAVEKYRDSLSSRQELMAEMALAASSSDSEDHAEIVEMSRRMTPNQRARMLRELMTLTGPPPREDTEE